MSFTNKSSTHTNTEWQMICGLALSKFESVCHNVFTGEISHDDVLLLERKMSQITELCSSLSSRSSQHSLTSGEMKRLIQVRKDEYDYFIDFEKKLLDFITCLGDIPIEGKFNSFPFSISVL